MDRGEAGPGTTAWTVRGPVDAGELGRTLIHEHVHVDLRPLVAEHGYVASGTAEFDCCVAGEARWNPGVHTANYDLTDLDLVQSELAYLAPHGVGCVVDATPVDLGRDPRALAELSIRTGLHIVMGGSWYLEATHRRRTAGRSVDVLAAAMVQECRVGGADTGIRPGILGEVGTNDPATDSELAVVTATSVAGRETGRAVTIHIHPWGREGHRAIDAAITGGIAPDRVLLNHMTTAALDADHLRSLLDRGVNLAFDLFGFDHSLLGEGRYAPSDWDVAHAVAELVRGGYTDRVFLSQDVGVRTRLHRFGGWGYDHLFAHVVPLLARAGCTKEEIETMLVANPRRLLTLA